MVNLARPILARKCTGDGSGGESTKDSLRTKKIESREINTSVHVLKFEKKRDRNSFFVIRNFWQNIPFGFAEIIIPKKPS